LDNGPIAARPFITQNYIQLLLKKVRATLFVLLQLWFRDVKGTGHVPLRYFFNLRPWPVPHKNIFYCPYSGRDGTGPITFCPANFPKYISPYFYGGIFYRVADRPRSSPVNFSLDFEFGFRASISKAQFYNSS